MIAVQVAHQWHALRVEDGDLLWPGVTPQCPECGCPLSASGDLREAAVPVVDADYVACPWCEDFSALLQVERRTDW